MKRAEIILFLFIMLGFNCLQGGETAAATDSFDTVLIVLGNEPLDDQTPTVDMIARVKKAVEYQEKHPSSLLLFTGGRTAGTNTEARMMAHIAVAAGASTNLVRLEERARSTRDNAHYAADFLEALPKKKIIVVSKKDHLEWAMHVFKRFDVFKDAQELASEIKTSEIIAQMEEYLKTHSNPRVQKRLKLIMNGERGTD